MATWNLSNTFLVSALSIEFLTYSLMKLEDVLRNDIKKLSQCAFFKVHSNGSPLVARNEFLVFFYHFTKHIRVKGGQLSPSSMKCASIEYQCRVCVPIVLSFIRLDL